MRKISKLLVVALTFLFAFAVFADETLSNKIVNIRTNTSGLVKLKDAQEDFIFRDTKLRSDYSFALGCELDKACINSNNVEYSGAVTSTEFGGATITLSDAETAWDTVVTGINPVKRWQGNGMNTGNQSFTTEAAKNNYSATYKRIGKWNNRDVDVKLTLVDFENISVDKYTVSASAVVFTNNQIGVNVTGVKWVKVKIEFLDSQTHEPVSVKGNTTYWDIDQNQGVIINSDGNTNKRIYYSNKGTKCKNSDCSSEDTNVDNQLYFARIDTNDIYIFDQKSGISTDPDDKNNLYSDNKNSLAYAISEEFEGSYIVRTIQYSNPIMINQAGEENIWTGHGGLFLSAESIEIPEYTVEAIVVNGTIEPENAITESGGNVTIQYSPNEGYVLQEIKVQGQTIEITDDIESEYTFSNITENKRIEVIYVSESSEIEKYTITTEVENGSITPYPSIIVESGESATIKYSPKSKYSLSEISIDGKIIDKSKYPNSYTFEDVQADHHIKVVYIYNPQTGIITPILGFLALLSISAGVFIYVAGKQKANEI